MLKKNNNAMTCKFHKTIFYIQYYIEVFKLKHVITNFEFDGSNISQKLGQGQQKARRLSGTIG